jgi:hypothetical protein
MAIITISDLCYTGSELLLDSESFLDTLSDHETDGVNGGLTPVVIWGIAVTSEYVIGAMVGGAIVGTVMATRQ